jgi:FkbM family methyltransferase
MTAEPVRLATAARPKTAAMRVDPNLIFDIGGHNGQDTEFYLKRGFNVVTVEADPDLAGGLRHRFAAEVADGRLTIVEAAIFDRSGSGVFYKFGTSVFGTTLPDWASRNREMGQSFEEIEVAFTTIGDLIRQYGVPYFMKVDIEGADMLCIEGLRGVPPPQYLSVEIEKHDFDRFRRDLAAISTLGYRSFQLVQQERVPFARIPDPPREGPAADHRFAFGASGLFGRELPDDAWMTAEALVAAYAPIVRRHAIFGDYALGKRWLPRQILRVLRLYPGWHDLHCRLGA